jgi:citrate synthase
MPALRAMDAGMHTNHAAFVHRTEPTMQPGLEGVVAAETVLSYTESNTGMQWLRGHAIPELVTQFGHEGCVALLWEGFAGTGLTRESAQAMLGRARQEAFAALPVWLSQTGSRRLDESVRVALASLTDDASPALIAATLEVGVPALLRAAVGKPPVPPDPSLPVAADVLRMLHDRMPEPTAAAALDTYFTVMADSGMNTSSFTARAIASTRASLSAAALGAWCAFTGVLHGAAPGPTLDLLDGAAAADDLDAWLETKLRAGERLMGFGHRVYQGNDPRAEAMRMALQRMGPAAKRLEFAAHLEQRVGVVVGRLKPGRKLPANVEIMAALLLDAVGIPREGFAAVFAIARCPGWIAHALEQQQTGRLIRPTSHYIGPPIAAA